jgi:hypothetical protein
MARRRGEEWIYLREANLRLFVMIAPCVEALANAITIGGVALRGVPWGKTLHVPIEGQAVREPTYSDIRENKLHLKASPQWQLHEDFYSVMTEWTVLNKYVRKNWLEPPPTPGQGAITAAMRESVTSHLADRTRPKRQEHIAELRQLHPGMTERQYDQAKRELTRSGEIPKDWSDPGRPRKLLKRK